MEILSFPILLLLIWLAWLFFPAQSRNNKAQIENATQEIEEEAPPIAPPVLYQLNTHLIRHQLYSTKHLRKDTQLLYTNIILRNLWINEPFHSTIFNLLLILDKDEFFIRDPFSRVITSNLRNASNEMVKVESYSVLSVLEIIGYCISDCIGLITKFRKNDAQNITFALVFFVLQKSENMTESDLLKMKKYLFENYPDANHIEYILSLFEQQHDERLDFIPSVYDLAIKNIDRHAYVAGSAKPKFCSNAIILPPKTLQSLPNCVL
jgi:hypothetical protein